MRITFNAPFTLTFSLACATVFIINDLTGENGQGMLSHITTLQPPFTAGNLYDYIALVGHSLGHANMQHLLGNLSFILLLGPVVESRYSSGFLLVMVLFTAIATGLIHHLLSNNGLLGASGIVFMLITLVSLLNAKKGEIPITFILIVLLFIGKEVYNAFQPNQVSELAHIVGGIAGSIFGLMNPRVRKKQAAIIRSDADDTDNRQPPPFL